MIFRICKYIPVGVRCFSTGISLQSSIKNVTIVGGGLMGSGIAQVAAQTNHNITLIDVSNDVLQKSIANIDTSLQRVAKKKFTGDSEASSKFIRETLSRITTSVDVDNNIGKCDLVIEAIVENLEAKQKLFAYLDKTAPKDTIFVSNTSALLIKEIAESSQRKDRFGGLHFFNPVPVMKLLEVIRIPETSDETYAKLIEFGKNVGKHTVTCKDTPGFIVNRLLGPYMTEAMRMLERGDATIEDIDIAMKLGAGYPMGPFELSDYVGLDTRKFAMQARSKREPNNEMYKPSPLLEKLVSEGKLGRKSGEGFYKYNK